MATPPIPTPAPAAGPAAGADPTMAGGAPPDDMGAAAPDDGGEMPVLFTVMGKPGGPYSIAAGDEPEGEGDMAASMPTFQTPQELMKAIMGLLNNEGGAEASFGKAFRGEDDPTAAKPDMPTPGM